MSDSMKLLERAKQVIEDAEGYKTFSSELDAPEVIQEIEHLLQKGRGVISETARKHFKSNSGRHKAMRR